MTEVAPHAGRRARREAEARMATGEVPQNAGTPAWHADANAFAPTGRPTGRPIGGNAPQSYGRPAAPPYAPQDPPYAQQGYGHPEPAPHGQVYTPPARPGAPRPSARPPAPPADRRVGDLDGELRTARGGSPAVGAGPQRGRHATEWGQNFEGVIGWTLLGSLIPGAGMIIAGRRRLGLAIVAFWVLVAVALVTVLAVSDPVVLLTRLLLTHPERLTYIAVALVLVAVLWAAHVVVTNLSLRRFATLTSAQSALSWVLVSVIVGGGVATAVARAQEVQLGGSTISTIFSRNGEQLSDTAKRPDASKPDPWMNTPRINVLLIGSDAGADRTGIRTDTLLVASIDTKSGRTVLFSIPRNLEHVPFPPKSQQARDFPQGYYCAQDACLINALWQFGVEHKNQYYKGDPHPGLTAVTQGVEQTLNLTIDDYAMLDLHGFMSLVDAVGGLDINVKRRLPVGGHKSTKTGAEVGVTSYIQAGRQHLNGYFALWFARSRSDSDDFERMRRQRCVIAALSQQVDPPTVAMHLTDVLKAAKDNIRTSIPLADLDAWVTLALRIKKAGHMQNVAFTDKIVTPGDPDFEVIHKLVSDTLKASTKPAPKPAATTPSTVKPTPSTTGGQKHRTTPTPTPTPDDTGAVDVNAVC